MMTTDQHSSDTAAADAAVDVHTEQLAALAANALALTHSSGPTRRVLLLDRAHLWEQLASSATTPACALTYHTVAAVCRQEAHLLDSR
jgi:hypothetical protein